MTLQDEEAQIAEAPGAELVDAAAEVPPAKAMTIGALCKALEQEFPDISISKIRYLEGEGLVTPERTRGGYRLFGEEVITGDDVQKLTDILAGRASGDTQETE